MPSQNLTNKKRPSQPGGRSERLNPAEVPVGVIGLGLMGTSIIACLLAAGHPVVAVTRSLAKHPHPKRHALELLKQMAKEGLLKRSPDRLIQNFTVSEDYASLADRQIVIESIIENLETKKQTLARIEEVVSPATLIGSNTSAIPVTILQQGTRHPERILGIHWAEPAHVTRFMEVICGNQTRIGFAEQVVAMARYWGKEPSLLRRDIRGFITNRIMYAMLREAFYLVENGYATIEDVDRSLRNDYGYWMTFAGPFRFMDLTGIPAYMAVMKDLWPELSCETKVPPLMDKLVQSGARGISNARGFYQYTPDEAKRWEKLFLKFTYEIRALALKYPEDIGSRTGRLRKKALVS
jgi:3-hydroxybutyryl-CoA dehydrogenase